MLWGKLRHLLVARVNRIPVGRLHAVSFRPEICHLRLNRYHDGERGERTGLYISDKKAYITRAVRLRRLTTELPRIGKEEKHRSERLNSLRAEQLIERYYPSATHPYRIFERRVRSHLTLSSVFLDAGCGRTAERLRRFLPLVQCGIGIDLVDFQNASHGLPIVKANLENIPLATGSMDLVMSVSVMEHLQNPLAVYGEIQRVLKPGGRLLFLTPNLWDYGSLAAQLIPSRFHPFLVAHVEGRKEEDTFPTYFRSNTLSTVRRLAQTSGFLVEHHEYLSQYPNYFLFSRALFYLGMAYERTVARMLPHLRGWLMVDLRRM